MKMVMMLVVVAAVVSPTRAEPIKLMLKSAEAEAIGVVPCPGNGQTCLSPNLAEEIMNRPCVVLSVLTGAVLPDPIRISSEDM